MSKPATLKRVQVQGKKYTLPAEEVDIEKLIKKGLGLISRLSDLTEQLEMTKLQIIEIASKRREKNTTLKLQAVSGSATVTFRESYTCDDRVEEIRQDLKSLFDRFFTKKTSYGTTKDLKKFLEEDHALGLENPETIRSLILSHVKKKETKPNVKITPAE